MKNNRRDFLKLSGMAGIGLAGSGILSAYTGRELPSSAQTIKLAGKVHKQEFNMSGYAAPKLDTVRIGYIGLGNRLEW